MDMESTFKWGDAEITVVRAKTRHRLAVDSVQGKLAKGADMDTIMAVRSFGKLLAQSAVKVPEKSTPEEHIGFAFPSPTAPEAELRIAYEGWLEADAELTDTWQEHFRKVDARIMSQEAPKTDGSKNPKK